MTASGSVKLKPGDTIGILGGGQLGRMLALAAARLGLRCQVFSPDPAAPPAGWRASGATLRRRAAILAPMRSVPTRKAPAARGAPEGGIEALLHAAC